jgi:hypothetical protein
MTFNIPQTSRASDGKKKMHTQQSRTESSFSPFRPGLKFESTNPVDPPDNTGGTGGTTPAPTTPPDEEPEEAAN